MPSSGSTEHLKFSSRFELYLIPILCFDLNIVSTLLDRNKVRLAGNQIIIQSSIFENFQMILNLIEMFLH